MVLINIYDKIKPIMISEKLGVGICNPSSDWIDGFCDEFEEEMLIYKHDIEVWKKFKFNNLNRNEKYNLSEVISGLGWQKKDKSDKKIIAEHLIEIQVINFENSYLVKKNEYMNSPTCETQYTKKFIRFCSFVTENREKSLGGQVPFVTYDSNNLKEKPLILNYLQGLSKGIIDLKTYTKRSIKVLKHLGKLIDDFIVKDDDFWLFDYILNALNEDNVTSAYHIFKVMSLIEMLIGNTDTRYTTVDVKNKLPQFISWDLEENEKRIFSDIVGDLRNSIAHGNFKRVQDLLKNYRKYFMKNFDYDEFEYSIENWTYVSICIELDKVLSNILWLMINDKQKMFNIKNS